MPEILAPADPGYPFEQRTLRSETGVKMSACSICGALVAHVTTTGGDDDLEQHRKWHKGHAAHHRLLYWFKWWHDHEWRDAPPKEEEMERFVPLWMDAGIEELLRFEGWPD